MLGGKVFSLGNALEQVGPAVKSCVLMATLGISEASQSRWVASLVWKIAFLSGKHQKLVASPGVRL